MKEIKVSEVKLSYRTKVKAKERLSISCSQNAFDVLMQYAFDKDTIELKESFKVILLNKANKVLGIVNLSEGGLAGTIVDLRMIFQSAILANACAIIIAHNHPSGNLKLSQQDHKATNKIKDAGSLLEIQLLDHILVTKDGYFSFQDEGLL